jgi:hypothetical protein
VKLFVPDEKGQRACHGGGIGEKHLGARQSMVLFHEYFHPETGQGLGANHQTGWTALVARLIEDLSKKLPKIDQK